LPAPVRRVRARAQFREGMGQYRRGQARVSVPERLPPPLSTTDEALPESCQLGLHVPLLRLPLALIPISDRGWCRSGFRRRGRLWLGHRFRPGFGLRFGFRFGFRGCLRLRCRFGSRRLRRRGLLFGRAPAEGLATAAAFRYAAEHDVSALRAGQHRPFTFSHCPRTGGGKPDRSDHERMSARPPRSAFASADFTGQRWVRGWLSLRL
jgi:hypothetical protein